MICGSIVGSGTAQASSARCGVPGSSTCTWRPSVTEGSARRRARAAATFWRTREKPVIAEANVPPLKRPPARR